MSTEPSPLEIVAEHLHQEANRRTEVLERDIFSRSSFNRYYYATFLNVKAGLSNLKPEWSQNIAHASIPQLLTSSVTKELRKYKKQANIVNDYHLVDVCSTAVSAASELAKLMELGNATRVVADYHPEIPVVIDRKIFLNGVNLSHAKLWPQRARSLVSVIMEAWRQGNAGS